MWPNTRPPSRTSTGDPYYNNNMTANPYSRNSNAEKVNSGRQSTDPWDWGWEDSSGQQDNWNNGWNQPLASNQSNPTPNQASNVYYSKSEKNTLGPSEVIPDKNMMRGNIIQTNQHQPHKQFGNALDFFENIDLGSQSHQQPPTMYSSSNTRLPHPSQLSSTYNTLGGASQNIQSLMFQPPPPQTTNNRHPLSSSYFQPPTSSESVSNQPIPFYQQPVHPQNITPFQNTVHPYPNSQYHKTKTNNETFIHQPSGNFVTNNQSLALSNNYYQQSPSTPSIEPSNQTRSEVENLEVPVTASKDTKVPPSEIELSHNSTSNNAQEISQTNNLSRSEEPSIPDNQETVPDNEEHLQDIPHKFSQMNINTTYNTETSNSSPGWENQEVAPRCELDRNQYLETGQLADSNEVEEEVPQEPDCNDEGEALPPPGLHRLVTGQGIEPISQRSVIGQNNSSGFTRLVPGPMTVSAPVDTSNLERMVLGQQSNDDGPMNSPRIVLGQQETLPNVQHGLPGQRSNVEVPFNTPQRRILGQKNNNEVLVNNSRTLITSQNVEEFPINSQRMVPGQQSSDVPVTNPWMTLNNQNVQEMSTNPSRLITEQQNCDEAPSTKRSVPGQQYNSDISVNNSWSTINNKNVEDISINSQRMVPGQQISEEVSLSSTQRMIPGQQGNKDVNLNNSWTTVSNQNVDVISSQSQRMVPGQQISEVPFSPSQRRVPGQQNTDSSISGNAQRPIPGHHNNLEDFPINTQRMVLGQQNSEEEIPDNMSLRMVPGQQRNDEDSMNSQRSSLRHQSNEESASSSFRMVPGQQQSEEFSTSLLRGNSRHQVPDTTLAQGYLISQHSKGDSQRLVPDQMPNVRMVPGQLSDDEGNTNANNNSERMMPAGMSEHENSFTLINPDDERMVPGGMSDDSQSQSISMDEDTRNSTERMIPGMTTTENVPPASPDNQVARLVTGGGRSEQNTSSQDSGRPIASQRNGLSDSTSQPRPVLQRLVMGQMNSDASSNKDHSSAKTGEQVEEVPGGSFSTPKQRRVVGQLRTIEPSPDDDKDDEIVKSIDRNEDSDSDYRTERRRHRHRKDTYDDERKERDYSSDRDYRRDGGIRREERREYRMKRDNLYNRSPEYRSDRDDYERNEYRDRRDRDRRERPKERERRRRSPDYSYDPYYRDDARRVTIRERDRRYYDYEDDPYYYREDRSRPNSRTGSDYRRQRDYPSRSQFYPDQGNSMNYYQFQQFCENFRRADPQGYLIWYAQYMNSRQRNTSNGRASVHSGRSSANDISQLNEQDEDEAESEDPTPRLFNTSHIRGRFNNAGQLIVVNPQNQYLDEEPRATVSIYRVALPTATANQDTVDFLSNPGPFISGVTHKSTVLEYLKSCSNSSCPSSEKLLYGLIRLVIKLNGVVDMTDVASLLMESYRSGRSQQDGVNESRPESEGPPTLTPQQVTAKFRDLLLVGNKTEALEWAMKNKDWGHALFLASKMDARTHNNVMLRFANGLQNSDPMQTLYQLMSGHEPQAATCAADKKWGDWRPHLAMMLSNPTSNIRLDRKAILTLGDSLAARGRVFAAHFCYLTAQLEFSRYCDHHNKLVLLGVSSHQPLHTLATCSAIMLTLCYEYAKQLSLKDWCLPTLRPYRYLLACRLYDYGHLTPALAYLESLARDMVRLPSGDDTAIAQQVINMAEKIKFADTTIFLTADPTAEPDWLTTLKDHLEQTNDPNYLPSRLDHGESMSTVSELEPLSSVDNVPLHATQEITYSYPSEANTHLADAQQSLYSNQQVPFYDPAQNYSVQQPLYYNPSQLLPTAEETKQIVGYVADPYSTVDGQTNNYWSDSSNTEWQQQASDSVQGQEPLPAETQPQISVRPGFGYFESFENNIEPQAEKPSVLTPYKKNEVKEKSRRENKVQKSGSGWFGGIWDKLALRPKNQMKLPDDKNPSIVWDEETKQWVNTNLSEREQSEQLKPPPKASELSGTSVAAPTTAALAGAAPIPAEPTPFAPAPMSMPTSPTPMTTSADPVGLPPPGTTVNKYKLQKGKGMRGNYVDVFGSNKATSTPGVAAPNSHPLSTMPVNNFFVPAPIAGNDAPTDFVSPSGPVSYEPSPAKGDDQLPPGGYGKGPGLFNPTK